MRGIRVQGTKVRQLRQGRGLTQAELARLAGVAERTVRNAESGRRVRLDFLEYLAAALGVKVLELVHDRDELRVVYTEQEKAERVSTALSGFAQDRNLSDLRDLIDDNRFRLNYPGPSVIPWAGEFRGIAGLQRMLDIVESSMVYDRPFTVSEIRASGDLVILSGVDSLRSLSTGESCQSWWQHIFEFAEGKVVRVDVLADTHVVQAAFRP